MKLFKYIFRFYLAVTLLILTTFNFTALTASAQTADSTMSISLLTCSPGEEVWAQYGHTAVRVRMPERGIDYVFNYGMFSSRQPWFIARFVLGLTDYKVAATTFDEFLEEYSYEERGVKEQVLDISEEDKMAIAGALFENIKPENQTYRYNFFFDNCTSRARDVILGHLKEEVTYKFGIADTDNMSDCSFRDLIHEWNHNYPWTQTGEDILLGIEADRNTTRDERQFLPDNLRRDFDKASYCGHPLVKETHTLLEAPTRTDQKDFPLSPLACGILLFAVSAAIAAGEWKKKKYCWQWDALLMAVVGIVGLIPTIMIFSEHPCVRINLLIFIINPLPLIMVWKVTKCTRNKLTCRWWKIWEVLLVGGLVGGFFQHEPWLMTFVALSLLIRTQLHISKDNRW